jgi:hypothetical protein
VVALSSKLLIGVAKFEVSRKDTTRRAFCPIFSYKSVNEIVRKLRACAT